MIKTALLLTLSILFFAFPLSANTPPLIVGMSADYPPFESYEQGKIVGFDVDLVHLIGEKLGRPVVLQDMDFNSLIPALTSKKVDMVLSGMDPTPERKETVDFSHVYYHSNAVALVIEPALAAHLDCHGKRVGVQLGSKFEAVAEEWQKICPDIQVEARARIPQLVEELKQHYIDILLVSDPVAKMILDRSTSPKIYSVPQLDQAKETAAIAFAKDSPLVAPVNQILGELEANGTLLRLIDQWMEGAEAPEATPAHGTWHYLRYVIAGMKVTLLYTLIALCGGFLLAIPLAIAKWSNYRTLRAMASFYTSIFRGTPLLVQLSIMYYGLPNLLGMNLSPFTAGILTFSLNSAAYVSEILLAGINAVDAGQAEAAKALGFSRLQTLRLILFPQALRNQSPALMNEMIDLLKESSLVSIIGEADIMRRAQLVSVETYDYMTPLCCAALCYYVLVLLLGQAVRWVQRITQERGV